MSYKMSVVFRCDGCGYQEEKDNLIPPAGWMRPANAFGQDSGPHFCSDCVKRGLSMPANLVPISVNKG